MRLMFGSATALVFAFLTWIVVADLGQLRLNSTTSNFNVAVTK